MPEPYITTTDTRPQPLVNDSPFVPGRLAEALNAGRLDDAEALVAQEDMEKSEDSEVVFLVGLLRMKQRRWGDAEAMFSGITGELSEAGERRRLLARNLAAVEKHHPELLPLLLDEKPCTDCRVEETPAGELTIGQKPVGGRWVCLTKGDSAEKNCRDHLASLAERAEKGVCIALCGVGDGYLLSYFASHPPDLFLDREHAIFIFEPHPEVLLHIMMIHDLSGEDGPFAQKRFQWCVGADWAAQTESLLRRQVYLPYPEHFLALSMVGGMMEKRINQLADNLVAWEEEMIREIHERYAKRTREDWVELLSESPPRIPRAMLITSRFTTVLQYSTRDIAEGLMDEGWETEIIIENEPWEMTTNRAILSTLVEFDPDVVIQIDHLRQELVKFYPQQLPFVCWIQDDLPNLTSRKTGESIGLRDFVLSCAKPTYMKKYGYPERQILYLEKLTRVSTLTNHGCGNGPPDLVFVSNASQIPQQALHIVAEDFAKIEGLRDIIEASGQRMIAVYETGDSIITVHKIRSIIEEETIKLGGCWKSSEHLDKLAIRMSGILNNALYRQQALDWVVEVAEEMGLSLELYGRGWEDNPKYARYAKGYIEYGKPLEELTRRAGINLQIIPYSCMHQRLLDGLTAGGFFLIRENPIDLHCKVIDKFMSEHITPDIRNSADALRVWSREVVEEYQRIDAVNNLVADSCGADLIEAWLEYFDEGVGYIMRGLPRLDEVIFNNATSCATRIAQILDDREYREEIQREQRQFVEEHYTYRGGFRRIMSRIGRLIETETTITQESGV